MTDEPAPATVPVVCRYCGAGLRWAAGHWRGHADLTRCAVGIPTLHVPLES